MGAADNILLIVLSPEDSIFEGRVEKLELPGEKGRFMVLKNHAPVISSLTEGNVVYVSDGVVGKIHISSGFAMVNDNVVTLCVEV